MNYAYLTDIGKRREKNEDSAFIIENKFGDILMMVFDGMGGHNLGDIASQKAQEFLCNSFNQKNGFKGAIDMWLWLRKSIRKTNDFLNQYAKQGFASKGMGTTFACFLIHKDKVLMGYVGDTRAYTIFGNDIIQHSKDETYVEFLYQSGRITREQIKTHPSRHVVTNALGCYPSVIINLSFIRNDFNYLLLCSDGLYNMVESDVIVNILKGDENLDNVAKTLIDEANKNGGIDNIACAIFKKEVNK